MSTTSTNAAEVEAPAEPKEPKVMPAVKNAARTTGRFVADANLRGLGRGVKALGRKLPKVQIVREVTESA